MEASEAMTTVYGSVKHKVPPKSCGWPNWDAFLGFVESCLCARGFRRQYTCKHARTVHTRCHTLLARLPFQSDVFEGGRSRSVASAGRPNMEKEAAMRARSSLDTCRWCWQALAAPLLVLL
jgi:hypothetical protein